MDQTDHFNTRTLKYTTFRPVAGMICRAFVSAYTIDVFIQRRPELSAWIDQ